MQPDRFVQAGYWRSLAAQDRRLAEQHATDEPNAACFHAQQAAEKALKAALVAAADDVPRVHAVTSLLDELGGCDVTVDAAVREAASVLDRYYAPTRYPDALGGVDPERVFLERDAREAVKYVDRIIALADAVVERERQSSGPNDNKELP